MVVAHIIVTRFQVYTVVRTNKGRTNKGQITFFRKIYWGLIRDKHFEKLSTKQKFIYFTDFFISTGYFRRKAQFTDLLV